MVEADHHRSVLGAEKLKVDLVKLQEEVAIADETAARLDAKRKEASAAFMALEIKGGRAVDAEREAGVGAGATAGGADAASAPLLASAMAG
eukprot:5885568-Alexandrium_andersonii.AAC.1